MAAPLGSPRDDRILPPLDEGARYDEGHPDSAGMSAKESVEGAGAAVDGARSARATRPVPSTPEGGYTEREYLEGLRYEDKFPDDEESGPPDCPGMGMDDLCTWPDVDGCGLCR